MTEQGISFDHYLSFLEPLGYQLIDSKSGRSINRENHQQEIPSKSTIDVLCRCTTEHADKVYPISEAARL